MLCAGAAYEKVRPQLDLPGVDVFCMCFEGQTSKRGKNTSSEILLLMTRQRVRIDLLGRRPLDA